MGVIRGNHVSPGVYTKTTPIRLDSINKDLLYKSTENMSLYNGDSAITATIYYGYYPLKSQNGKYTEEFIKEVLNVPFKHIIDYEGIKRYVLTSRETSVTNHEDVEIPVPTEYEETNLRNLIDAEISTYTDVADNMNTCVLLLIPRSKYRSKTFDIIDERFTNEHITLSIKDKFNFVYEKYIDGTDYYLLCMYNENYGYSRVCKNKIIAPITIRF